MEMNSVSWFEIPVTDMQRAKKFYETVLDIEIAVHDFNGTLMGWFPFAQGKPGASGSLIQHPEWYKPSSSDGVLIYLSSSDVQQELDRVEAAGGQVLKPKTMISESVGYMGVFLDSEGNRMALHSHQ
ncbi:MAG: VOC family protein [Flavobacteriaceae bacterium]|nr:VOC family protein [Flavobacteriaceae bacterium]